MPKVLDGVILDELDADPATPEEGEVWRRDVPAEVKFHIDAFTKRFAGLDDTATFVYQPGGVAKGNVYTDWAALMADMGNSPGPKVLRFDNSLGTITIPAGAWDMTDVIWEGRYTVATAVTIPEGVTFTGLRRFRGYLYITCTATTTVPVTDLVSGEYVWQEDWTTFRCTGSQPMFRFATSGFFFLIMRNGASLQSGSNAVIDLPTAGGCVVIAGLEVITVGNNTISGITGTFIVVGQYTSSANISQTHTAFAGSYFPYTLASHLNLAGIGTNTHAQLDTHVASTANPHGVTAAQVGAAGLPASLTDHAMARADGTDSIQNAPDWYCDDNGVLYQVAPIPATHNLFECRKNGAGDAQLVLKDNTGAEELSITRKPGEAIYTVSGLNNVQEFRGNTLLMHLLGDLATDMLRVENSSSQLIAQFLGDLSAQIIGVTISAQNEVVIPSANAIVGLTIGTGSFPIQMGLDASGNAYLGRQGVAGAFRLSPGADNPQWLFGNPGTDGGAVYLDGDCASGGTRPIRLNTLGGAGAGAPVIVGSGGIEDGGKLDVDGLTRLGAHFASSYRLSVQNNTPAQDWTYIEILNSAGANQGAFFGIETYAGRNDFSLYNWQGGNIVFWTHPSVSNGLERFTIHNDGTIRVHGPTAANYAIFSRVTGNFSISVRGTDARAFYKNCMIERTQLGGTTAAQYSTVSNGADQDKFTVYGDGDVRVHDLGAGIVQSNASGYLSSVTPLDAVSVRSGAKLNADFSIVGGVMVADVTFSTAYPDTNYSVNLEQMTANNTTFALSYSNKATTGFRIELNSASKTDLTEVSWTTTPYNA